MSEIIEVLKGFAMGSGIAQFFVEGGWKNLIMIAISCVLIYLAIRHKFEPLLLLPIAFGMLLTNLPISGLMHMEFFEGGAVNMSEIIAHGGLFDWLYLGVKFGIYPPLIFLGVWLGLPMWAVVLLGYGDEISKVTLGLIHLRKKQWVRNVTAQIREG